MRFLFIALILIFSTFSYSQNLDSLISKGLRDAYKFDFESAEKSFDRIINENPEKPHGYYYLSQLNLWYFIGSNDSIYLQSFNKYFDATIEAAETQLDSNDDLDAKYYLGTAHVLKSLSLIYSGEYWSAFRAADKGVSFLEDCIDENPEYFDAYFGIGIIGYTFSFIPSLYKFLVGLFGVPSDKEEAIGYLKKASEFGLNTKLESQFYLSKMLNDYSADYEKSIELLIPLSARFENNLLIKYQLASTKILLQDFLSAENDLLEIIGSKEVRFKQTIALSNMLLGDIYFWKNEFKKSLGYYKLFIQNTNSLEYSGYVNFQMALCYTFLENSIESKKYLLLGRLGNHDIEEDIYAKAKCEYFFENGFSNNLLFLIRVENLIRTGKITDAKSFLLENNSIFKSEIEKDYYNYLFGKIHFENKDYSESLKSLQRIEDRNLEVLNWIYPTSYLLQAQNYCEINDLEKAQELLDEAEAENEYEHQKYIQSQIVRMRSMLKKK